VVHPSEPAASGGKLELGVVWDSMGVYRGRDRVWITDSHTHRTRIDSGPGAISQRVSGVFNFG